MSQQRIHITAALCTRGKQVLIARRSSVMSSPLLWEFPGGKVEAGETAFAALQRELKEELDLSVIPAKKIGESTVSLGKKVLFMECFHVPLPPCIHPVKMEHHELAWTEPSRWRAYDWAPADIPLVEDPEFLRIVGKLLTPG